MTSQIDLFKIQIAQGLHRPNRYEVFISFPLGVGFPVPQDITIMCEEVDLPGNQAATVEEKQWGPVRKMPYLNVYNDLSLVFMCSNDMKERNFFDIWHNRIINKAGFRLNYYDDFIATVTITTLDEMDLPTYQVRCDECYPIEVISQHLSYGETDTYLKMEVRMAYRNWVPVVI